MTPTTPLTRALLALAALLVPVGAALGSPLSKADFQDALVGAMTDRNLRNVTLQGEQLKMQEVPGIAPQGAFRVNLISVCEMLGTRNSVSSQAGQVMRYQNGALFANMGNNVQFLVQSQVVQPHQRERVEKALTERLETLNGEYRDLRAEIRRQDNGSYQLVAQHDFGGETGSVRSRLGATLGNARFMICDIHTAMELADHDRWKSLRSTKLGQMDRGTFITLYPLLKESGYELKGDLPGGTWGFKLADDLTTRVENHGQELKFWVYTKPPSPPDAARMASIVSKVRGLSLPLDAVRVDPHEPNPQGYIWVALVFSYANMTGDDFADVMKKLIDKRQILDFHKRVARAVAEAY
ncbi:MAG: hypothetical protein JNM33_03935 [Rubrivivax sp.]|nr:hypothetical protein [Rubrivivax sp.]